MKKTKLPEFEVIKKMYESGDSYQAIADVYGCTRAAVAYQFRKHGANARSRSDARKVGIQAGRITHGTGASSQDVEDQEP